MLDHAAAYVSPYNKKEHKYMRPKINFIENILKLIFVDFVLTYMLIYNHMSINVPIHSNQNMRCCVYMYVVIMYVVLGVIMHDCVYVLLLLYVVVFFLYCVRYYTYFYICV